MAFELRPPLRVGAAAVYDQDPRLEREFVWKDRLGEPYAACRRSPDGKLLYLPREVCPPVTGLADRRSDGVPITVKLGPGVGPRSDEQRRVLADSARLLRLGRSHVIQATTGFGKTFLGAALAANVGRKTLVIVWKSDLADNWRKELTKFLPGVKIGTMRQDVCDVAGKDIVIGMLQSLCKDDGRWPDKVMRQFGLVIVDEVHKLPAEEFVTAIYLLPARLRIGLSATPERFDGKERLMFAHMGRVGVTSNQVLLKPKVIRYETGWKVPRNREGERIPHSANQDGHIKRILARNARRNALICHVVSRMHLKQRNTIVFSERREHLDDLFAALTLHGVKQQDCGFYVGGMKADELDAASAKPVVLATYQMASTGTNCPWWDACVLATPRSNVAQAVGRILREHENKPRPIVIDLVDSDSHVYHGQALKRMAFYTSSDVGADVVNLERPELG